MTTLSITLTPNRHPGPPREYKFVVYRRNGDKVIAYRVHDRLDGAGQVETFAMEVDVTEIKECTVAPEIEAAWHDHVQTERHYGRDRLTLAQRREQALYS